MEKRIRKGVVVGGSIAGVSCAHALMVAGWDVVVVEKSCAPQTGSPTGAGLGLDPQARQFLQSWLSHPHLLHHVTMPLALDQNQATDSEKKISWTLTRDESFNFRAAHWADLHALLYKALPRDVVLWGHHFLSFNTAHDKSSVTVKAKVLQTDEIVEIVGDLLIAADGSLSTICRTFLPELKLRYLGYSAWRGVLDFSENENSDTIIGIRRAYPELGNCLYFDLAPGTHCVLYELQGKKINWIWYFNQPEPVLKGSSVTIKVSSDMIEKMHE
ncbi:FAD-dependent monooxygenase sdgC-like [Tasmannia lanceolata]